MYEYSATVNSVIDGDTIDVTLDLGFYISWRTRVRMFGINTPELHSSIEAERKRAVEAKDYLTQQVNGKMVKLVSAKSRDKFGRFLATVWLPAATVSVNDDMIAKGLAKPWDGQGEKPV